MSFSVKPIVLALRIICACAVMAVIPNVVQAHPHVWVVAKTTLLFDEAGNLTGLRHHWVFDKPYSAYITTGLDTNKDGKFSEEELADLAKENTEALVDFHYFTKLKIQGKEQAFAAPNNYRMSFENGNLHQYFDLPLKVPANDPKLIGLKVYDESFFVAFSLAETQDAVLISGTNKSCPITISRPKQADMDSLKQLSEDYFANAGMGAQYANNAVIACP